ncbi:cytochrome P450 [Artemisia annua]|uniref:Cytochrome P450 n=1 Tax=Artemisia annua TaxID=35608 RepID=A0A2U1NXP7_ARTAN|nr:cytochrome P450 [Artemisia annua]
MLSGLGDSIFLTMITFWSWWWEIENKRDGLACTFLTVSVPTLIYVWYKWTLSYSKKGMNTLPPGPYGLPFVGYLPFLGSNLHKNFTDMAHIYGPIFSLKLGTKLHVVVNSINLVKIIARDLDQTFANRSPPITALAITYGGLDVAWSNNNAYWRKMRKLLVSQVLSNKKLKSSQIFRTLEVRKTVNEVYTKIGTKIDINEIAFNTQVNVVTSMLWGCSKSCEGNDSSYIGDRFREVEFKIIELIGAPNVSDFIPMLSRFDLQRRKRDMLRQLEYVDRIIDKIIEDRIKVNSRKTEGAFEEDGKKDILQILLELKEQKGDPKSLNIIQIKALLMVNVVTSMLWGCSKSCEGNDSSYIGDRFREVEFKIIQLIGAPNVSDFIPMLSRFDLQRRKRDMLRQLEYVDRIIDKIIEDRIKVNSRKTEGAFEEDGKKDILQILLELKEQKGDPKSLNIIQIKALLMDSVCGVSTKTIKVDVSFLFMLLPVYVASC